jgi:hypothetical protein
MSKLPLNKSKSRPRFLTDFLVAAIPLNPIFATLLVGSILGLIGLLFAQISGLPVFSISFMIQNRAFFLAIVGITICLWVFCEGSNRMIETFKQKHPCFDTSKEGFFDLFDRFEEMAKNKVGTLSVFSLLALSLGIYAKMLFPAPIFRDVSSYTIFDYYVFFVFLLVLMMISLAVWGLGAGLIFLRRLRKIPIFLEKIPDLEPAVRTYLGYTIAYFFCVGLVYLGMPFAYTVFVIIVGNVIFIVPQVYLHEGIKLKKQEILSPLQTKYWSLVEELHENAIKSKGIQLNHLPKIDSLNSLTNMIHSIKSSREWVIDYSSVIQLIGSGTFVVVAKYLLTGSL